MKRHQREPHAIRQTLQPGLYLFGTTDRAAIADELGLGFMKEVTRRSDPRWLELERLMDGG